MDLDWNLFFSVFIVSILLVSIDIGSCIEKYKKYIKKKEIFVFFPTWKNTKKHFKWYAIWSFIDCLNLPIFLIPTLILNNSKLVFLVFVITIPPYLLLSQISFFIFLHTQGKKDQRKARLLKRLEEKKQETEEKS